MKYVTFCGLKLVSPDIHAHKNEADIAFLNNLHNFHRYNLT